MGFLRYPPAVLGLAFLAAFTLLLHLPFLSQPPQSDEVNYLDIAANIFEQPWTPLNFRYVFQGQAVDMSGHPHPPLNAYILAAIWRAWGSFSPVLFHSVYLLFSLGISVAAYTIAKRYTKRPLWVALLIASAPVIQVAGNSLETDALNLCLLLVGAAFFLEERFLWSGVFLALAGFTSLQSLAVALILPLKYVLDGQRPPRGALAAAAAPFVFLGGWQLSQLAWTGKMPLALVAGTATGPVYGRLSLKLVNAQALLAHLGLLYVILPVIPRGIAAIIALIVAAAAPGYPFWERALLFVAVMLGVQVVVWLTLRLREQPFLAVWCLAYLAFCFVAFFAGAARYLMPLALPLVILAVRKFEDRPVWFGAALAFNVILGLNLAVANYDLGAIYNRAEPPPPVAGSFLVNGELGFRSRMTRAGGRALETTSAAQPGEWIVRSELCLGGNRGSFAEALAVPIRTLDLASYTPVRLMDRYAHSGFYSAVYGSLPFSFSRQPLDRITYFRTSPYWKLDAPWTATQINGRLVFVPQQDALIRLPLEAGAEILHVALFARGTGQVRYLILGESGETLLDRTVSGETWEPVRIPVQGRRELTLSLVSASAGSAGWGELVTF